MSRNKELKAHRLRQSGRLLCSIRSNRKWCKRRGSSLQCQNCFFVYPIIDCNLKNLPQAKRRPRREPIPYICDFSRGGLNARFKRSHPNLAPRPQICFIYLQEFCLLTAQKISWRDLGKRTGDVEVLGNEIL